MIKFLIWHSFEYILTTKQILFYYEKIDTLRNDDRTY